VRIWLNEQNKPSKTNDINLKKHGPAAAWHICVKLKEAGTQIIFNPFAVDHE
jgi:hypothetical protein